MSSFRRSLLGYRRADVDAAIAVGKAELNSLQADVSRGREALAGAESEAVELAGMVVEREREMHILNGRLAEAQEARDRTIASLESLSARLADMDAQARGQATRIRMKALREAVEVSRRVQALTDETGGGGTATPEPAAAPPVVEGSGLGANGNGANGHGANGNGASANGAPAIPIDFDGLFEGRIRLEIGPLGDFSQLVGFEDTIGELGASEISVERFSEGRATLSMHLEEPTDLLRELESHSALDFKVRHTAPDNLVLDLDDEGEAEAA
jgi:hypothetical protein